MATKTRKKGIENLRWVEKAYSNATYLYLKSSNNVIAVLTYSKKIRGHEGVHARVYIGDGATSREIKASGKYTNIDRAKEWCERIIRARCRQWLNTEDEEWTEEGYNDFCLWLGDYVIGKVSVGGGFREKRDKGAHIRILMGNGSYLKTTDIGTAEENLENAMTWVERSITSKCKDLIRQLEDAE